MGARKVKRKTPHPVDCHVGRRLQRLRKMRGFSQTELGEAIAPPITFQQIQKYEQGTNRICASKLWEISCVLKVSPAYFYEDLEGANCEDPLLPQPVLNASRELAALPPRLRDAAIIMIKGLAKTDRTL